MTRLNEQQLRTVNKVVLALYDETDGRDPIETFFDFIQELMPVAWLSVDEAPDGAAGILHRGGRNLGPIPDLDEKIARFCHMNPVVSHVLQGNFSPALRVSDFVTFREIRQTAFYRELVSDLPGWRDQSAMALRLPGSFMGFGLNRDALFTDEERLMLELVQPHFERVMTRHVQFDRLLGAKALTAREREVLHWMAEGKRDREIALILGRSERTIHQHAGSCLQKLGVENRASAVAAVWRARSGARETVP